MIRTMQPEIINFSFELFFLKCLRENNTRSVIFVPFPFKKNCVSLHKSLRGKEYFNRFFIDFLNKYIRFRERNLVNYRSNNFKFILVVKVTFCTKNVLLLLFV